MTVDYEVVIGLEVHAQLLTKSKLFCACSTRFGEAPNQNVCPVCLGLPGALPVLNQRVVELATRAALSLGCDLQETSVFARKNYFYPDLPKGYQISQFDQPIALRGHLTVPLDGGSTTVNLTRIHIEEDAGKTVHGVGGDSIVNLNRAGVPLIEIVSEPELRSSAEAAQYMRALREILVFAGVNDGNLEEGSLRCDANVSLRPRGETKLGTRCEIKNLNSYRFLKHAIESEVLRQKAILDAGGSIRQETRGFEPDSGRTYTMRSKEDAHDYRYFPEPDLPMLRLERDWLEAQKAKVTPPPQAIREYWMKELGLTDTASATLSQHPEYACFFDTTRKLYSDPIKLANWMLTEVLRGVKTHGLTAHFSVSSSQLAELLQMVDAGEISGKQAKVLYAAVENTNQKPGDVAASMGLKVVSDESVLRALCEKLVQAHPKEAASVRAGKKGVLGFFVGQIMKATGGAASPRVVSTILGELMPTE